MDMSRDIKFVEGEMYHIFNRGVDKRNIFNDKYDIERFLKSMEQFNSLEPIGSIYENRFNKNKSKDQLGNSVTKLVNFICYCLNPNHFHFILVQVSENGIEKFMHRLLGYSRYYNNRHKRSGVLFQGPFKAVHIDSNEQLLHTSVYVNLNDQVHKLGNAVAKLVKSSWEEYANENVNGFCKKDIILKQFKNKKEYKDFSENTFESILEKSME